MNNIQLDISPDKGCLAFQNLLVNAGQMKGHAPI